MFGPVREVLHVKLWAVVLAMALTALVLFALRSFDTARSRDELIYWRGQEAQWMRAYDEGVTKGYLLTAPTYMKSLRDAAEYARAQAALRMWRLGIGQAPTGLNLWDRWRVTSGILLVFALWLAVCAAVILARLVSQLVGIGIRSTLLFVLLAIGFISVVIASIKLDYDARNGPIPDVALPFVYQIIIVPIWVSLGFVSLAIGLIVARTRKQVAETERSDAPE